MAKEALATNTQTKEELRAGVAGRFGIGRFGEARFGQGSVQRTKETLATNTQNKEALPS